MSIPEQQPAIQKKSNRTIIGIAIGILVLCFCILVIGGVGGGIALTNSWATATKQEQYIRETATKQEAYLQATATKQEQYAQATATKQEQNARATATKLEQFARATATQQEQYAQATARADTIFGMVPDEIAGRFPNILYYEPFDRAGGWTVGHNDDDYSVGDKSVSKSYIWSIETARQKFATWETLPSVGSKKDFYFQTDARLAEGDPLNSCYGISFRRLNDANYYLLVVCEQSFYLGHLKDNKWIAINDWQKESSININETNQLGVSAVGENFEIYINAEMVYSFTDENLQSGKFAIVIEKFDKAGAKFEFDNIIILTK